MLKSLDGRPFGGGRVLRNFSMQLGGELVAQAIAFAAAIYLAHVLDPDGFGVWVFSSSVLLYFTIVIDGGTDVWGMREIAARPRRLRPLVSAILVSRLILGVGAVGAVLMFALFTDPAERTALLLGVPILLSFVVNTAWAHRGLETGMPGVAVVVQRLAMLALVVLLVRTPGDAVYVTLWQGLSEFAGVAILLVSLMPRLRATAGRHARIGVGTVFAHSWPLALSRGMRALAVTFAVVVLGFSQSTAEVGYYGAALRIATVLLLVSTVFSNAAFPGLARACRGRRQKEVIAASMRLLFTVVSPIAVGGIILSRDIIAAIFPPNFIHAGVMLAVLLIGFSAMSASDLLRRVLAARHRQKLDLKLAAAATVVSVTTTAWLGIQYGGIGAAASIVTGEFILLGLSLRAVARTGPGVSLVSESYRPITGALIMGAVVALTSAVPLIPRIAIGAAVYFVWLRLIIGHLSDDLHLINDGDNGSGGVVPRDGIEPPTP